MKLIDRFLPCGGWAILSVCLLMNACSFSPPPNTGAYDRGLTETNESKARPAPVAVPQPYRYFTNSADDRLIESHTIKSPPIPPGHGPVPVRVVAPASSNWMTAKVLPKPMMTNQIPGSVILSRITTTDKDGKKFTAELTLIGDQTIYANDKMSLVMFAIYQTNFVVEFCTNLTDGIWHTMSSGVGQNTNSALAIFDLHEGTKPVNFYRRKAAP